MKKILMTGLGAALANLMMPSLSMFGDIRAAEPSKRQKRAGRPGRSPFRFSSPGKYLSRRNQTPEQAGEALAAAALRRERRGLVRQANYDRSIKMNPCLSF